MSKRLSLLAAILSAAFWSPAMAQQPETSSKWLEFLDPANRPSAPATPSSDPRLAWYQEQVRRFPTQAALHFQLALLHHQSGNSDAAEAAYREALRLDPRLSEAAYNLAALLLPARPKEAQAVLVQAISHWNVDADLHYAAGLALEGLGQSAQAQAAYARALSLQPKHLAAKRLEALGPPLAEPSPQSLQTQAEALLKAGKSTEGQAKLQALIMQHPAHVSAYDLLARQLEASGRNREAASWREQLQSLNPCYGESPYFLGRYYFWAGFGDKAIAQLETQQTCRPMPAAAQLLAQIQRGRQQPTLAQRTLEQACATWPTDPGLRASLAAVYLELGRMGDARAQLSKLMQIKPVPAEAQFVQGQLHLAAGQTEQALHSLRQALALNQRPEYRLTLALAYVQAGMGDQAFAELQTYLKSRPGEAQSLQALLKRIQALPKRGRFATPSKTPAKPKQSSSPPRRRQR